ncbi:hypothetical protein BDY21DRAFT_330469 [Lineolata rhizophorae]|uniref:Uncharacterized protein n=1 Tax=Lineolata rhizophorae TaxID=578093 RepID=A0A6A6PDR2_9PEZI|nr:hypothetical protein BDY21DRAFT_330469 [Lineolata rhizophorae]
MVREMCVREAAMESAGSGRKVAARAWLWFWFLLLGALVCADSRRVQQCKHTEPLSNTGLTNKQNITAPHPSSQTPNRTGRIASTTRHLATQTAEHLALHDRWEQQGARG